MHLFRSATKHASRFHTAWKAFLLTSGLLLFVALTVPDAAIAKPPGGGGGGNGGGNGGGGGTPPGPEYTITFLGFLPGVDPPPQSIAYGMNNFGEVVGEGAEQVGVDEDDLPIFGTRAFIYTPGTGMCRISDLVDPAALLDFKDENDVDGWIFFEGTGINDSRQIVGNGKLVTDGVFSFERPFRLTPPEAGETYFTIDDLGALITHPNADTAGASAINNSGDVTGGFNTADPMTGEQFGVHAFLYTNESGVLDLGQFAGQSTRSHAISDRDTDGVIHLAGEFSGPPRAFRYTTGSGFEDLGTLKSDGSGDAVATGINNFGDVVGFADADKKKGNENEFAFVDVIGSEMSSLGTLSSDRTWNDSSAIDINDFSEVIGLSMTEFPNQELFYHSPLTGMVNLEDQIINLPASAAGNIAAAVIQWGSGAINDEGEIIGTLDERPQGGWFQAFILQPVLP